MIKSLLMYLLSRHVIYRDVHIMAAIASISDLYILDVPNMRWARPLYEGQAGGHLGDAGRVYRPL